MTDDDPRTVADVFDAAPAHHYDDLHALGIDPDMPYSQFRRRLEMGERAENTVPYTAVGRPLYREGWNACLDHIRGDR